MFELFLSARSWLNYLKGLLAQVPYITNKLSTDGWVLLNFSFLAETIVGEGVIDIVKEAEV